MDSNTCVMKEWTFKLSWKEQTVLISALRGCDGIGKHDISKKIVRRIRNVVLNNAGTEKGEFMRSEVTEQEIYEFSKNIDAYPVHFLLHLIHASEVIGYCCNVEKDRKFFKEFYNIMVSSFHMIPESKEQMHLRLEDGSDTCCHKT
jgi:hypothetical protein